MLPLLVVPPLLPQCTIAPIFSAQLRSTFNDLAVDGNDLWTATGYGVALYDRRDDPPSLVASLALPGNTRVVRVANGVAYVGTGNAIAVVQKNGRALTLVRTTNAGAQVNDLAVTASAVYAATANGLAQFDLFDWSRRALPTSGSNVTSLALLGSTLYAADNDSSVEVISVDIPSLPQSLGTFPSLPRVTSVKANNGKLYTSDGRQSEVFGGAGASMTRLSAAPFGIASLAPVGGDVFFAGASDRNLSALDFTTPATPIQLWSDAAVPSLGTVNRIQAMATAPNRLYVAAGDAGLLAYDTSGFAQPFPLHGYATGGIASVLSLGDKLYVPRSGGGVTEFVQSTTGALTQARSWDNHNDVVFDGGNNFLLTGSDKSLTLWTLVSTTPQPVTTATFRANVVDAVLRGLVAYAVLADGTLWTADMTAVNPPPQQVALAVKPTSIARSGNNLAVIEPRPDDGLTFVLFAANADFANATITGVGGVATAPVALDDTTVAIYTFAGVNLIHFPSPSVTIVPQSTVGIARALALSGSTLLVLTDSSLSVFNAQKLTKQYAIPSSPAAMSWLASTGPNVVDIATETGITTINLSAATKLPALIPFTNASAFYKKVVAAGDRFALFDSRGVDVWTPALQHTGAVRAAGIVDIALSPTALYALFSNRTIARYSPDAVPLSQTSINDAPDSTPLAIFAVGNAVWVSISKGCTSGGCTKSTLIYDAALSQTATLGGGVVDVTVDGNRAYAIVDAPSEIRAYDITDAAHPTMTASRPSEGAPSPVSIGATSGTVYVLGEKLYTYNGALTKLAEPLGSYASAAGVTFVDQRVRTANGCGVVSGRATDATLYALPAFTANATQFPSPSTVRSLAQLGSTFYLLTDHSLEVWSSAPMPPLPRKRPTR
ncbi:MAG TPA: hypothetical protein VJZ76_11935 [Thermoanaerobaculia bacterium]|nr:hypothetical protein [Thermoanaerobaculia bacterium]